LKRDKKALSRGEVLRIVAKTSKLTIREITEKAGYKPPSFYLHVKQDDLPYETLARYGKALGHNFTDEFPEMSDYLFQDDQTTYQKKKHSYEELEHEKERWQGKYQELNEKYHFLADKYQKLLEEKLGLGK
jgi:AcrR family transcriptional regulator